MDHCCYIQSCRLVDWSTSNFYIVQLTSNYSVIGIYVFGRDEECKDTTSIVYISSTSSGLTYRCIHMQSHNVVHKYLTSADFEVLKETANVQAIAVPPTKWLVRNFCNALIDTVVLYIWFFGRPWLWSASASCQLYRAAKDISAYRSKLGYAVFAMS
jgi:hypothetical protein